MGNDSIAVKKVAPYPIPADIFKAEGQPPLRIQIVKLTDFGFLAKAEAVHFYQVGENYQLQFSMPLTHDTIRSSVKVIKTYDAIESIVGTEKIKLYTVEFHFLNIAEIQKILIQQFLVKIGQTK